VCQRHRFESEILPEAERNGWPKIINWGAVRGRVERMKERLQALLDDTGRGKNSRRTDDDDTGDEAGRTAKGPRAKCVFWQEVIKEVKTKGSRAVVGVSGQFANFDKTQPG
jgi:hypothetical protein